MKIEVDKIVETLQAGGVILIATDTVYGLASLPHINNAVSKIYELKKRPRDMHLPIMVSKIQNLEKLGIDININTKKLLNSNLVPGAISFVVGFNNANLKPEWLKGRDEIAFRIPDNELLLNILDKVEILLVTSANLHGTQFTPNNVTDILLQLNGSPDLVIEDGDGKEIPSTIINCRLVPPKIERLGLISETKIKKILENE